MASPYSLATSYVGETLLSGFNWFDGSDPNHGFVAYQCRDVAKSMGLYSVNEHTEVVRLGVDSTNSYALGQGRPSIRLESKQSYNEGLFIADFLHMPPSKCGLWPAFWAYGSDWPNNGEIDIIEGANLNTENLMSAHTRAGCSQPLLPAARSLARFTGRQRTANCFVGGDNTGCGYDPPAGDATSYGDGFNAVGGGVYAMQWDAESIKLWHFERGMVPPDVEEKRPNPEGWGLPQAVFGGETCDTRSYWRNMNLVLNINFCGDFGGGVWGNSECQNFAPTCDEFVARNPSYFADAYWDVRYIDVYQQNHAYVPPPPAYPAPPGSFGFPIPPIPLRFSVPPSPGASTLSSTHMKSAFSTPTGMPTSVSRVTSFEEPSNTVDIAAEAVTVIPEQAIMRYSSRPGTSYAPPATSRITSASRDPVLFKANHTRPLNTRPVASTIPGLPETTLTWPRATITTVLASDLIAPSSVPTPRESSQVAESDPCNEDSDSAFLSCFKSDASFPGFVLFRNATDMTVSECAAICSDANTSYAGLFKTECHCSHYFDDPMMTAIEEGECDHECPGDATQSCGGALTDGLYALSIYDVKEDDSAEQAYSDEMSQEADPDDDSATHVLVKSPVPAAAPRLRPANSLLGPAPQRQRDCVAGKAAAQSRAAAPQTETLATQTTEAVLQTSTVSTQTGTGADDFGREGLKESTSSISVASQAVSCSMPMSTDVVRIKGDLAGPAVSSSDPLLEDFPDSPTTLLWLPTLAQPSTIIMETRTPDNVPLDLPTQAPESTPLDLDLPTQTTVSVVPASPNLALSGASRENVEIWRAAGALLVAFFLSLAF